MKRPASWIAFAIVSAIAAVAAVRYFPQAFSIVALDIRMDRERALEEARQTMTRLGLGPAGFRQAASFTLDSEAQTFVELEGGGKPAFTEMLRSGLYSAYTWRVRQFKEGEPNETTIRFTPEGRVYGFVESLREDAPGAALSADAARKIAEDGARAGWQVDLAPYTLIEQGQERRVAGRVDHTLTYERSSPTLNEGRYRLRLVVSGDRLTEVSYFIRIPEAFTRRYANMRGANDAIGTFSAVAMALLYILGGIGVGLFFMLRQRWVLWRQPALWGMAIGLLQALALINQFPLIWTTYDTAVPRSTFLAQQVAIVVASFVGFSGFFGLSFMAAETLTRRAFGHHPQLWRVWSKRSAEPGGPAPGASRAILRRTVGGYLLVPIFLAYDVLLYMFATRYLGWWSPSEALLHPDVLATYVPWLSAIANSFQAGFWEEALFRAVPLAGAALIGDRIGHRRLCLVAAFIIQTLVFGAGHAQYPAMPSYVRPVELIIPSIGFGLLYLYFGLLPAIVLHYAFDAVLFSIPIFLADAPGIWFQKVMVVLLTLVPLWVVLWRRVRVGHWTELSPADRNGAWAPPPAAEEEAIEAAPATATLGPRARAAWLAIGAASLVVCIAAVVGGDRETLAVPRSEAARLTRDAIAQRGVTLDGRWHVMPIPDNGAGGPHEFVSRTAGEARRKELLGRYLPSLRWRVRVATFEGDVADRAEEWRAQVVDPGQVRAIQHDLPEARPGASLDEAAARAIAVKAIADRFTLDAAKGQIREISAKPEKQAGRTDWTFTFVDATEPPLPQGEPRIAVNIAGDEVSSVGRFVHVPEDWERRQRAAETRGLVLRIADTLVFAGLLVTASVLGMIAWGRRRYSPALFFAGAGMMFAVSIVRLANGWPLTKAALPTAASLQLQMMIVIGIGFVGLVVSAGLVGLTLGGVPKGVSAASTLSRRDGIRLGVAGGLFAAAVSALAVWLRTPPWARAANMDAAGTFVPALQAALDPATRMLMTLAVVLSAVTIVDRVTHGWTRRRAAGIVVLAALGFAACGVPSSLGAGSWLLACGIVVAALIAAYVTLLRFDPAVAPLALGVAAAVGALAQAVQRPYPGALVGSLAGALLAAFVGWWWFGALRSRRENAILEGQR